MGSPFRSLVVLTIIEKWSIYLIHQSIDRALNVKRSNMDYRELLKKYNLLLSENSRLIKENDRLKVQLGTTKHKPSESRIIETTTEIHMPDDETTDSTGSFIGEGFDEPRLDTLFLAMPISWKGTLQQYAGRLHRLFIDKKEVQIYDYVDIHVRMLERMYQKRLTGYASMGYKAKSEDIMSASFDIIFDKDSFLPVFNNDLASTKKEVLIVSPFVRKRCSMQMVQHLKISLNKGIRAIVVTRPEEDFKTKDRAALQRVLTMLEDNDIHVVFKSNIHQKFAIIDQKIVWYGSINLLSYGSTQESIMRIESSNIANELIKSIEGS